MASNRNRNIKVDQNRFLIEKKSITLGGARFFFPSRAMQTVRFSWTRRRRSLQLQGSFRMWSSRSFVFGCYSAIQTIAPHTFRGSSAFGGDLSISLKRNVAQISDEHEQNFGGWFGGVKRKLWRQDGGIAEITAPPWERESWSLSRTK